MKPQERDTRTADRLWAEYARTHDPRTREALVHQFEGLAHSIANRYVRRGIADEDLFQVARMGLVKAVDRFDPSTRYQFSSFAAPTILGEIRRHFRDHSRAVHVSRSIQELEAKVERAGETLSQRLGRAATPAAIAAELGVTEKRVREVLALQDVTRPLPLDGAIEREPESEGSRLVQDCLGENDPAFARAEARQCVHELLPHLSETLREVVQLRYLGELSQREAARRLGLTQMQVCRLERRALAQLRSHVTVH